jgi:hypothetical protein
VESVWSSNSRRDKKFFLLQKPIQTDSGPHLTSYLIDASVLSGDKRLRRDVDHPPPSGAEVNNEGGYISSPCLYVPTRCGHGQLCLILRLILSNIYDLLQHYSKSNNHKSKMQIFFCLWYLILFILNRESPNYAIFNLLQEFTLSMTLTQSHNLESCRLPCVLRSSF